MAALAGFDNCVTVFGLRVDATVLEQDLHNLMRKNEKKGGGEERRHGGHQ